MKLTFLGSTGLVGSELLNRLLKNQKVTLINLLVRRPMKDDFSKNEKVKVHVVDFNHLPEDKDLWQVDAVICTLGTTMKDAGSKEKFRLVDYQYPLSAAKLARKFEARHFVLNSAMGADANSIVFYNRVKGEVERDIKKMNFNRLTIVRPGLIGGKRTGSRPAEEFAKIALGLLEPILPKSYRMNPASKIAQKIEESLFDKELGLKTVPSKMMI